MFVELKEIIKASDMVLVGLGEEFNDISFLKKNTAYAKRRQVIEETGLLWLLPAYEQECRKELPEWQAEIKDALYKLVEMLQDKNYFVVSTSVNDMIQEIPWKPGRLVMPCGGSHKKQCCSACEEAVLDMTEADKKELALYIEQELGKASTKLEKDASHNRNGTPNLGSCPKCKNPYILNNIYAEDYDESGYLPQWQLYTKWLQGTLNKKVLILELGVGMKFPSVIRWPFEKVAFFNQKASFYRVNENLYQMSEELKDKGVSISKNAIDWLRGM